VKRSLVSPNHQTIKKEEKEKYIDFYFSSIQIQIFDQTEEIAFQQS
jgi:hypothetical protein